MPALHSSLYAIAFSLCLFATGLLRDRSRTRDGQSLFLLLYLGSETLGFALELLVAHPASPFKALWLALLMVSSLLPAPLLFLAIKEQLSGERPDWKQLGKWTWLGFAATALLLLPLSLSAHAGSDWSSPVERTQAWHFSYIHAGMLSAVAIFAVQAPCFLARSKRLLAHANPHGWLHLPLVMVGTAWGLGMLRVVQCASHAPLQWVTLFTFTEVLVTAAALFLMLRRAYLPVPAAEQTEEKAPVEIEAKYAKSGLDPQTESRISQKLENALARPELVTDPLLTLESLSKSVGERSHYVSQVINQVFHQRFYDLVNQRRVSLAQTLLLEQSEATVLEIADAVGYNSKSTFNAAFRKFTGSTPTQFRQQHRERAKKAFGKTVEPTGSDDSAT